MIYFGFDEKRATEYRPPWGKYWPDNYPDKDLELSYQPIYGWIGTGLSRDTSINQVKEITEWLILNIDNVWEGPIGYMGIWNFRFTEETDYMAFKLLTV